MPTLLPNTPLREVKNMPKHVHTQDLVVWYTVHHLTLREIGRLVGMSATAVMKRLRKVGIVGRDGQRIIRPCGYCGIDVNRPRSQGLRKDQVYCCVEHYYASLENPEYQQWRHGGRLARAIVAQHYPLQREQVVHHKDGNQKNNDLANLAVYADQQSHLAVHRGRNVQPVWDGVDAR